MNFQKFKKCLDVIRLYIFCFNSKGFKIQIQAIFTFMKYVILLEKKLVKVNIYFFQLFRFVGDFYTNERNLFKV